MSNRPSAHTGRSRLLVVDPEPSRVRPLEDVLKHASDLRLEVQVASSPPESFAGQHWDVVLVNVESLPEDAREARMRILNLAPIKRQILYGSPLERSGIATALGTLDAVHVFDWRGGADDDYAHEHLCATVRKILHSNPFGLIHYLEVQPSETIAFAYRDSKGMKRALAGAEKFAQRVKISGRAAQKWFAAVDEITNNALFSAAVTEDGLRRYAHLSRRKEVELGRDETIVVRLAATERLLAFSVMDPFGALVPREIASLLSRRLSAETQSHVRAAGEGIYMAFQAVGRLVFNIEKGARTEVIGLFERRRRSASNSSLDFFMTR